MYEKGQRGCQAAMLDVYNNAIPFWAWSSIKMDSLLAPSDFVVYVENFVEINRRRCEWPKGQRLLSQEAQQNTLPSMARQRFVEQCSPRKQTLIFTVIAMAFMYKWCHRMEEQDERKCIYVFHLQSKLSFLR